MPARNRLAEKYQYAGLVLSGSYRFLAESPSPALNTYFRRSEKIVVIAEPPFNSPPHPQNPDSQSGNLDLICVNTRKLSLTSNNCFHRSVILIVEKVIEPMKKRSGPSSRKALVEIFLRKSPVPAAQFLHQNSRVAIPCFQQLFSPIGDFNCRNSHRADEKTKRHRLS